MTTFTNSSAITTLGTFSHGLGDFRFMIPSVYNNHSGKSVAFSDLVAKPAFYRDPDGSPQNYYQERSNIYNGVYRQGTGSSIAAQTWTIQANEDSGNMPIFQAYTGRNRGTSGATYAPPVIAQLADSTSEPIKLSDYVGMTPMGLAQDDCDLYTNNLSGTMANWSAGFVGGTNYYNWFIDSAGAASNRKRYSAFFNGGNYVQFGKSADKRPQTSGAYSKNTKITFDDGTIGLAKTGIQYIHMHRVQNQWAEFYLHNITAPGDLIVVCVVSSGGTMYTHTTTDPFYVRTVNGSSISGNSVVTNRAPLKNETGTDTWVAVYSMQDNTGGAARIGLNPYHSSSANYTMFGIFVIKGPYAQCTNAATTKYTGGTTGSGAFTNVAQANLGPQQSLYRVQSWNLVTAMSPFANNGGTGYSDVNNGGTFPSTAFEDYRWMAAGISPSSNDGAWSGSWADDTSYRYVFSTGKFGSSWGYGGYSNTGMQFTHLRQDFEVFQVCGTRGHGDFN